LLHKNLYVQEEGQIQPKKEEKNIARVVRDVGNVTSDTELTFEYGVRPDAQIDHCPQLPFQVHIYYTKLDGSKYVRVISRKFETTTDRSQAEKEANIEVISAVGVQKGAKIAQEEGDYTKARMTNFANMRLLARAAQGDETKVAKVKNFVAAGEALDSHIRKDQKEEKERGLNYSDEEDDEGEEKVRAKKAMKQKERKAKRGDASSNVMYQMKKANAKMF